MNITLSLQDGELEVKILHENKYKLSRVTSATCRFQSNDNAKLLKLIKGDISDEYLAIFRFETQEREIMKAVEAFLALGPKFNIHFGCIHLKAAFPIKKSDRQYSEADILKKIEGIAKGHLHLRDHLKAKGLSDAQIDKRLSTYLKRKKHSLPSTTLKQGKHNKVTPALEKSQNNSMVQRELNTPGRLYLISHKGMRIESPFSCTECSTFAKPVWRYAESNAGEVYLCSRCKPRVLNRSFDKLDAMNVSMQAGRFESNRRRH